MIFVKVLNFLLVRGVAIILGALLYIYCAVQHPPVLRYIQYAARRMADHLESNLSDQWAVWVPLMNLEHSFAFVVFIVGAYMIIEILERSIGWIFSRG